MYKVLKSFPYAEDGIHIRVLEEGETLDFGSCAPGLTEAGFIAPAKAEKTTKHADPVVEASPEPDHAENAASDAENHVSEPADATKPKRKR